MFITLYIIIYIYKRYIYIYIYISKYVYDKLMKLLLNKCISTTNNIK